jgi:phosphoadenosine phosphosulfate reductase
MPSGSDVRPGGLVEAPHPVPVSFPEAGGSEGELPAPPARAPLSPSPLERAAEKTPLHSPDHSHKFTAAEVRALDERFSNQPTEEVLEWAWRQFGPRAAIGTSFQGAGLVMLHLAKARGLTFPVFTLDTGLLFPETVALKKRLEDFFGFSIESLEPDLTVEEQADINGPELWKHNPDLCCTIRKVLPLRDKLGDLSCWITGLRRQQSEARAAIGVIELYSFDAASGRDIVKLNPMANWSRQAVWDYLRQHQIPYNPLYDQGYRSIGCQPCTRKTTDGQNERAGRWTGFDKVECGIHTFMPKKVDFQI